jgi:hypothetical protein
MRRDILRALDSGPKSVPEIAEALGYPSKDVLWWVMGFVRFGFIEPTGETTADGYHRYTIVEKEE